MCWQIANQKGGMRGTLIMRDSHNVPEIKFPDPEHVHNIP